MELLERDLALDLLAADADAARRGRGRTALVTGEAGIGKTALVTGFVAARPALRVLWGGCEALFSPRPLGPLYDIAPSLGDGVHAMLSQHGRHAELFAAVLAALTAGPAPTCLVIEDLHWADAATLDLVKYLARRIHRAPVLMVLTYRDDELGERHPLRLVLGDLPAADVSRVPLLPLSAQAVAELARRASRDAPTLFAATGGNPFLVTEALRAEGLPATVRDAVLARTARQPDGVRAVLDLAAVVPARVEAWAVSAVLAPDAADVAAALASGLLHADGESFAYRHELARVAVEQSLPAPLAASLHARLLACLEERVAMGHPLPPARLVHHARGAGDTAAVLRLAPPAAALAAQHGAHREAAELCAVALERSGGMAPIERARLLEQRAYQCYLTDQIEDAISARLSALAIWRSLGDREQEARALRWLSRLSWFQGRNHDAERHADAAVALLQDLPEGSETAWAWSNRAQLHMLAKRDDEAVDWGRRAIALATRLGDDEVLSHALNNVGAATYTQGDAGGRTLLERSLAIALEGGWGEHVARAYANLTANGVTERDYAGAQRYFGDAAAYFAARDLDSWSNYLLAWQARLDLEMGRWHAAGAAAARLALRSHGVAPVTRIPALAVLARLRARRGDPGAQELLAEAAALAADTGELQRIAPVAAALAEAQWLGLPGVDATRCLHDSFELAGRLHDRRARGELAFWLRTLGLETAPPTGVEPAYELQFAGRWREAAAAWRALGCPYEFALALLEGDDEAAREGLALLDALGAAQVAKRWRAQLRDGGMPRVPRGPRASTAANPAGLTARELQVLGLLAEGLANAEIARRLVRSEKTVDHHVSAILSKLDVPSRGAAARAARERGLLPEA